LTAADDLNAGHLALNGLGSRQHGLFRYIRATDGVGVTAGFLITDDVGRVFRLSRSNDLEANSCGGQ